MKYDCSKTLDYVHERERMCESFYDKKTASGSCLKCPLSSLFCFDFSEITQNHIDIVQKWSDEHPEKTRKEAFFELFPKADADIQNKTPVSCYGDLVGDKNTICVSYRSCATCWNEPYAGEFERAREEKDD